MGALIPYLQETVKTADAPAPVLDQNRRPTVDVSGQVQGLNQLARASQMPLIDPDPFVAKDRALSQAGRAVAEFGGVMQAYAQQKAKAKDYTDITAAKARMDDAMTEFEIWKQKNPDPSTWAEGWNSHFAGVQKGVMADPNLSVKAREQITALGTTSGRSGGLRVELDAAKTIGQRAEATATVSADQAYNRGDRAAGDAILADAVGAGFLMSDRAHALSKAGESIVEKREQEAVYNQNYGAILADANGWLEANKQNKNGLDPKLHNALEAQAYQQKRLNQSAVAADFSDAMVTDGAIKSVDDIDGLLAGQRPAVIAEAKSDWRKLQDDKVQAHNASLPGLLENTGQLMGMIDAFDGKGKDADAQRIRAEYLIKAMVPEGYRSSLIKRLDAKFNPPKTPANPTVNSYGEQQISAWFKDGKFGAVTRPVAEGEEGYVPPTETGSLWWKSSVASKQPEVSDPAARDNAMMARAQVEMDWMDWQQKNPNAGIEEGRKALGGIARGKLKSSDLDALMSSPLPTNAPAEVKASDVLNRIRGTGGDAVRGFVPGDTLKGTLPEGLKAHAQDFIDAAKETGLNPKVLAAISALETAGGTSSAFRNKRNAMGISDSKGPTEQASVRESIFRQARTLARADGPYGKAQTIEEIGAIYAPPGAGNDPKGTNSTWSKGVRTWLGKI